MRRRVKRPNWTGSTCSDARASTQRGRPGHVGRRPFGPWLTCDSRTMLGPSTERTAVSRIGSSAGPGAAPATRATVLRGRVVTPSGVLDDGVVVVTGDWLSWVGPAPDAPPGTQLPAPDAAPRTLLPGGASG